MRVLIDTDVLLDIALDRAPHSVAASRVLQSVQSGHTEGLVAWHTLSNIYYLLSAGRNRGRAVEFLRDVSRLLRVAPADDEVLRVALSLQMPDFEDAMQVACGLAAGAEGVITRNLRDFRGSPLRAIAPGDFT